MALYIKKAVDVIYLNFNEVLDNIFLDIIIK